LTSLYLANTAVGDEGLRHLRGHPTLAELGLSGTAVSDSGLAHLEALPALQALYVRGCNVTDAGVAALRRARPGIAIYPHDGAADEAGQGGRDPGAAATVDDLTSAD
jgi:hypothetical protein